MNTMSQNFDAKTEDRIEGKANHEATYDSLNRTRIGTMTYLAPSHLNTTEEQETVRQAIDECVNQQELQIVIDLAEIGVLRSTILELFLDCQEMLARRGGWLRLTNLNAILREVLRMTGLNHSIGVISVDDVEQTAPPHTASDARNRRMGDLLIDRGLITEARVKEAIGLQGKLGKRMGQILVDRGWVAEQDMLMALAGQLSLPFVRLRSGLFDPDIAGQLPREVARRLKVLPLFKIRDDLFLATSDPQAVATVEEVVERTGCNILLVITKRDEIIKTINDAYGDADFAADFIGDFDEDLELVETAQLEDYTTIDELAAGSPVINLVNSIIQRAIHDGASDIHIEPARGKCRVRFRIDGLLYEVFSPKIELHPALVSRLKVMANLDIAERRMPQDGRIQVHTNGRSVDLRFSSLPGLYGEKVVLRVLDKNQAILDVNKLGMTDENLHIYKNLLDRSYGLILVTGPTGSGKTTSLYAAINYLNSIEKNIVTIEDPVEYQIDIINQNEVRANIGLTFAKMLKHVLRQDPDVVMVGEIRERETAEIAVQAALTGHLVLSTLHTNDSVGAVSRMIDMGVEPYLLSSALIGVVAQRLVRQVCPSCKTTYLASPDMIERYGWQDQGQVRLVKGRGCVECYDSGYRGRMGLHEIVEANGDLQRLIISNPSRDQLTQYMQEAGIKTLYSDGLGRVLEGRTSLEEVHRVVNI
ncbi:MAG: type II secretion system protein GspE [Sedimenticola sp.]|nr:MAG: type II secretion system protein GspE [Sedimenticola sp.]